MSSRDAFSDFRRSKEEEYFRKREAELLEKMKRRLRLEAERKELKELVGGADEEVLVQLQDLGFNRDTVLLLHMVPLLAVGWADGSITQREREQLLKVAELYDVEPGSSAHKLLAEWLVEPPSDELFRESLRIIPILLSSLPAEAREAGKRDLVSYSAAVASASGGILGIGPKTSSQEKKVIEEITAALEQNHKDAAVRIVKD
jgi:hypothetical protein